MRIAIVVIMMLFLESCAIFGAPTELDDTKGMSADRIYALASEKLSDIELEIADVAIYLIRLADILEVDVASVVRKKLAINESRF